MIHHLKCQGPWFRAVMEGTKTFEYRKDDRGVQVGDTLVLCELDSGSGFLTGRMHPVKVTYVLRPTDGCPFPMVYGWAIFGIAPMPVESET